MAAAKKYLKCNSHVHLSYLPNSRLSHSQVVVLQKKGILLLNDVDINLDNRFNCVITFDVAENEGSNKEMKFLVKQRLSAL